MGWESSPAPSYQVGREPPDPKWRQRLELRVRVGLGVADEKTLPTRGRTPGGGGGRWLRTLDVGWKPARPRPALPGGFSPAHLALLWLKALDGAAPGEATLHPQTPALRSPSAP